MNRHIGIRSRCSTACLRFSWHARMNKSTIQGCECMKCQLGEKFLLRRDVFGLCDWTICWSARIVKHFSRKIWYLKRRIFNSITSLFLLFCAQAVVKVLNENKTKLKVDQEHVETVIPAVGKPLIIVNGAYRGEVAFLRSVDKKLGRVNVEIESVSWQMQCCFFCVLRD